MGGSRTEWAWPDSATSRPNGLASDQMLGLPGVCLRPVSSAESPPGNGFAAPETNRPKPPARTNAPSRRPKRRRQSPPIRGNSGVFQEISANARVRGGAERTRTISQDIMPDRAAGDDAPAAVEIPSFTHRIDRPCENTTCQTRLGHDVVFLRRPERRVTQEVFDTLHIDRDPDLTRSWPLHDEIDAD